MPKYIFTFKKDDVKLDITTDDKEFIAKQFGIWVCCASVYTKKLEFEKQNSQGQNSEIQPKPQLEQQHEVQAETQQATFELQEEQQPVFEPQIEPQEEVQTQPVEEKREDLKEDVPKEMLKQVQHDVEELQAEESIIEPITEPAIDIAEPAFEEIQPEPQPEAESQYIENNSETINSIQNPTETKAPEPMNFENVLEEKIENPTFDPSNVKDEQFLNLLKSKNPQTDLHYLIITAYCLNVIEGNEKFSLKQINSKLMHNLTMAIGHETIVQALSKQLIIRLPDLTNSSNTSEYQLTELGEMAFLNGNF
jgi:hypothetical protein